MGRVARKPAALAFQSKKPVAPPKANSPGKVAAMSQAPQEDGERLRPQPRSWGERFALILKVALLLAIGGNAVAEHLRYRAEVQRMNEQMRRTHEDRQLKRKSLDDTTRKADKR